MCAVPLRFHLPQYVSFANFNIDLARPECAAGGLTWGGRYVTVMLALPVISAAMLISVAALPLLARLWQSAGGVRSSRRRTALPQQQPRVSHAVEGAVLSVAARLLYLTLATHAIGYFVCVPLGVERIVYALEADYSMM